MSVMRFTPSVESKPIREIAYETLKHAIITGQIPAGARIVETEYADKLHISRTPLREALRKLERDGLVEYVLRRGVVVRAFTIADVEEIYTIRNALEMLTLPSMNPKRPATSASVGLGGVSTAMTLPRLVTSTRSSLPGSPLNQACAGSQPWRSSILLGLRVAPTWTSAARFMVPPWVSRPV